MKRLLQWWHENKEELRAKLAIYAKASSYAIHR